MSVASRQTRRHRTDPQARVRLVCFPYAGGGATAFGEWGACLRREIDVCAVQLPGRQSRLAEPPIDRLDELVDAVEEDLAELDDLPWALFGHSFGALVAYELARRRESAGRPVCRLFVAACSAPQLPPKEPLLHVLDEPELLEELSRLGNVEPALLADRELLDLVLPALRADLTAFETYDHRATTPLGAPITAFAASDDVRLTRDDLAAWRAQTTGAFTLHAMAGGHFFLEDLRDELLRTIERELRPWTT
jgi:medium-chain acyl-[acyl-carrier-protein] hydrolase